MNPHCKAFTLDTEEKLAEKWALIPNDTDILVTHSPPYGIRDAVKNYSSGKIECYGSKSLQMELFLRLNPKLTVFGHIHEGYGIEPPGGIVERCVNASHVNASHVNEHYEPVNKPIRIIL
jgi:Icc-related predicted phosphoesterase